MLPSVRGRGLLVGTAMSAVAGALLVATTDVGLVADRLGRANLAWLAPAAVVLAGQAWVRATRWAGLIRPWSGRPIGARRVVGPMLIGYLVNAVMPGRLGEVARSIVVSRRDGLAFGAVAASVVVERAVDLTALAALVAGALRLAGSDAALGFAALAIGAAAVIGLGRRAAILERLLPDRTPARVAGGARAFLGAIAGIPLSSNLGAAALSAVAWLADGVLVLLVAGALGLDIPAPAALAIALGGALGSALPAAPGYLATYELGAVALGTLAGVPADAVLSAAILTHVIGVTSLAAAGAVALGRTSGAANLASVANLARERFLAPAPAPDQRWSDAT